MSNEINTLRELLQEIEQKSFQDHFGVLVVDLQEVANIIKNKILKLTLDN